VNEVELSRTGKLQSFVVTKAAPPGYSVPHAQGYVTLGDNGPTLFTLLTEYDESKLQAGGKMELKCVETRRDENNEPIIGYRFRPVQGEENPS
jgi:uncharacterized OB-fold protein